MSDQQSQQWQDELMEYLVHDLKSPLATILSNFHLLEQYVRDTAGGELLQNGRRAALRMERMILNILDIGRLEVGQLELKTVKVPIEDLLEEAIRAVHLAGRYRGVEIECDLKQWADVVVRVDFDLMTRVIVNLLDNAIRFSPDDSPVIITATRNADAQLVVAIKDRGIGVPEQWQERIFDKYIKRGEQGPGRSSHGMGLTFAKLVSNVHGITIGVRPGEPEGSEFYLIFPPHQHRQAGTY